MDKTIPPPLSFLIPLFFHLIVTYIFFKWGSWNKSFADWATVRNISLRFIIVYIHPILFTFNKMSLAEKFARNNPKNRDFLGKKYRFLGLFLTNFSRLHPSYLLLLSVLFLIQNGPFCPLQRTVEQRPLGPEATLGPQAWTPKVFNEGMRKLIYCEDWEIMLHTKKSKTRVILFSKSVGTFGTKVLV